jgi:hypothetical protein
VDALLSAVNFLGFAWDRRDTCCSTVHRGQRKVAATACFAPSTPTVPSTPPAVSVTQLVANDTSATVIFTVFEPQGIGSNGGASITSYTVKVIHLNATNATNATTTYNVSSNTTLPITLALHAPPLRFNATYYVRTPFRRSHTHRTDRQRTDFARYRSLPQIELECQIRAS